MILRHVVLGTLRHRGRGDGAGDGVAAARLERARWQCFRGATGPERMTIAGDDREPADALLTHEVEDLRALRHVATPVAGTERCVARAGPRARSDAGRKILRIGAPVERAERVAPDLPGRGRALQLLQEPPLLHSAEHAVRR